jgi:N-acyl homoserine lactone hydrolase
MHDATPERLYLMQLIRTKMSMGPGPAREMVVVCYLITLSDGRHILVDSGLPADAPLPPGVPPPDEAKSLFAYLQELDLQPADIDIVICTHFDIDHAGNHDAFTNAEFVVQRTHYELAKAGDPRYALARSHWDNPALHYRLVEGDVELFPGLKLIETGGHAPSHQSVLVHLPETGPVLLAIDAVTMAQDFTPQRNASPMDADEAQLRASTQKLLDVVAHEGVKLTVFGHDGAQWQDLKKAPEYYT